MISRRIELGCLFMRNLSFPTADILKIKTLVALLVFAFAIVAGNTVSAQDLCKNAVDRALPLVISAPPPVYPAKAVAAGVEGDVEVDVKIDAAGAVMEATFVSGHEMLKEAVLVAASKWKFNETVEVNEIRKARLTFTFSLDSSKCSEPDLDEIKYKFRINVCFTAISDCFDDCGNAKSINNNEPVDFPILIETY